MIMKKTLLVSAMAMAAFSSESVQAEYFTDLDSVTITNMMFETNTYQASGDLYADGSGFITGIDPFFYHTWSVSQQTVFLDNSGSWSGTSAQGLFDYDADIAAMAANEFAVGLYMETTFGSQIAVLEIFNCAFNGGGTVEAPTCNANGSGVVMDNGPFAGSFHVFNGIGTAIVPIPAAAWLMGSGLLGLAGFMRRRK